MDNREYSIESKLNFIKICDAALEQLSENLADVRKFRHIEDRSQYALHIQKQKEKEDALLQSIERYKVIKASIVKELTMNSAFLSYVNGLNFEPVETKAESEKPGFCPWWCGLYKTS